MYSILTSRKVLGWITKGDAESDPFDKYVSYFIAFNVLYSTHYALEHPGSDLTRRDRQQAISVLGKLNDQESLVQSLEPTLREYLDVIPVSSEEYWNEGEPGIAMSLKLAVEHRDTGQILENLLKWLYKVRCNIVHGGKGYDEGKWGRMLMLSSVLLRRIVVGLIE